MKDLGKNNLKLSVCNFGPIEHAEIELRPVTVFLGPSNTGKSFLAVLIYALHRLFCRQWNDSNNIISMGPAHFEHNLGFLKELNVFSGEEVTVRTLCDWFREAFPILEYENDSHTARIEVPREVFREITSSIDDATEINQKFIREIERSFGIRPYSKLIRYQETESTIGIKKSFQFNKQSERFSYVFNLNENGVQASASFPKKMTFEIEKDETRMHFLSRIFESSAISQLGHSDKSQARLQIFAILDEIVRTVCSRSFFPLGQQAYYLPANRSGILQLQNLLVGSLIRNATTDMLEDNDKLPLMSGVEADFLEQLVKMGISNNTLGNENLNPQLSEFRITLKMP